MRLLLPLLLFASSVHAAPDAPTRTRELLAALKAGDFATAAASFDPAMKAALPPAKLAEVWSQVKAQAGVLKSEGPLRTVPSDGVTTVLQKLSFEAAALDLRVAVRDATGEITGLFFTPASDEGRPLDANIGMASGDQVAALPAGTQLQPAPAVPSDPAAIATTLLDDLRRGRFADAAARFDVTLTSMLPPDRLAGIWGELVSKMGALRESGTPSVEGSSVTQRLTFAGGSLDMKTSVDAKGRVAGLLFAPVTATSAAPPSDAPFVERPIRVGEGDFALDGLLTTPRGGGPFPAVVLVHGSGPHDRDETIGPNKPFRDLAWGLAGRGVASLRYDKRTKAHPQSMTTVTLDAEVVDDAVAAVRLARTIPAIDPRRVVLAGHSLGAMVAPRIARRAPELAGVAFLAGPSERLEDAILRQTELLSGGANLDELRAQVARVKSPELTASTPSLSLPLGLPASYWLDLRSLDPPKAAAALPQPLLFIHGGRDYQVLPSAADAFRAAMPDRKDVTFVTLPSLNHLLIAGEGAPGPTEYLREGRVAGEVLDALASFAKAVPPR